MTIFLILAILLILFLLLGRRLDQSKQISSITASTPSESHEVTEHQIAGQNRWEIVSLDSERWTELEISPDERVSSFGKLYHKTFKIWCQEVGSKQRINERIIKDRYTSRKLPRDLDQLLEHKPYLKALDKTSGHLALYSGVENERRRRWYVALIEMVPTWIQIEKPPETHEPIIIDTPDGWERVPRNSPKWFKLDFGDKMRFPGYGKVHALNFDVWYTNVGSTEKHALPSIKADVAVYEPKGDIYHLGRAYTQIEPLKGLSPSFERKTRPMGYLQLYNYLDNSSKRRFYLGVTDMKPTFLYTSAE